MQMSGNNPEITHESFLSDEESKRLFATIAAHKGERDAMLIWTILVTGARGCEIVGTPTVEGITPASLNHKKDTIMIRGAKGSCNRTVPIPAALYADLLAYIALKGLTDNQRLFPITTRQLNRIWAIYRPNKRKGTHAMRHTLATRMYINCKNIRKVQGQLGHRNVHNTNIYVDYVEKAKGLRAAQRGMWNIEIDGEE